MRLLLDEHYSPEVCARLRAGGRDAVAVAELGIEGIDDRSLLEVAASERRALVTNNVRHFASMAQQWAAAGRDHHGVLFTSDTSMPRGKSSIGLYVEVLTQLMDAETSEDALLNHVRWLP